MTISTFPAFRVSVLIKGRAKPIESHNYDSRAAAEEDLAKITAARTRNSEVPLTWLQFPGHQVQGAYIEDRTTFGGTIDLGPEDDRQW